MSAPACPQCGHALELVTDGAIGETFFPAGFHQVRGTPLPMRLVQRPFGACPRCEFCIDIDTRLVTRGFRR